MKWIILFVLIVAVGDEPQSRPVPVQRIAQPLDELVPLLDSLSCKLEGMTIKIEKL
ncbi:hypothetical protein [Sphingobacterium corticibacter]|uniref:hypothetical protein n=1 Tax=Sphingobacterium corticibacter TaxID=2171749 RepID=UPI0013FE422A|nr:hypothetical protein [Sphingobacterium corticibacter]